MTVLSQAMSHGYAKELWTRSGVATPQARTVDVGLSHWLCSVGTSGLLPIHGRADFRAKMHPKGRKD